MLYTKYISSKCLILAFAKCFFYKVFFWVESDTKKTPTLWKNIYEIK